MDIISYGRQSIDESDVSAVVQTLNSSYLTQGPRVKEFEDNYAKMCQARYALSVSNATAALHTACLSLGLKANEYVWTSPVTFVASANCAIMCGAKVDFVDIDKDTYNFSPEALVKKIKDTAVSKHPKVIIPVHFSGSSCDMEEIQKISNRYGIKIIEDASHAVGAKYKNKAVGSCEFSDISVFSFHPVKIITTGEGGMLTTNQENLYNCARRLASHGIVKDRDKNEFLKEEPWRYKQTELGYNYRLTDIQSSLGLSQLKKLNSFIKKRLELCEFYNTELNNLPLKLPVNDMKSSWHLYVVQLESSKIRLELYKYLREYNIYTQVHYVPVHMQPFYKEMGFEYGDYPNSEQYYEGCLSLPLFPSLTKKEQIFVINKLKDFFKTYP